MQRLLALSCLLTFGSVVAGIPLSSHVPDSRLVLDLDSSTGAYKVLVDGNAWFLSGDTGFTEGHVTRTLQNGGLKLKKSSQGKGSDGLGQFTVQELHYESPMGTGMRTRFKSYDHLLGRGEAIVFEQTYEHGANATTTNATDPYGARDGVSSMFPSFKPAVSDGRMGYLAFAQDMTGSGYKHSTDYSAIPTGVAGTGPISFFSKDLSASVVMSPFSQFMAASCAHVNDSIAYGAQGSITSFPEGYSLSFIVTLEDSPGAGINSGFEFWGDLLLKMYGKSREVTYNDYGLKYLSYSTDNGAFYYYQTEGHAAGHRGPPYTGGKTYQDTLNDVKKYAETEGIPYRYILLDSWWYYQGKGGGVSNWIGRPDVFPDGNSHLRNSTGWPIMGHNRYWAVDNVYAKQNGGQYNFVMEKKGEGQGFSDFSWPSEQRFWDDLMYNSSQWGLFMYEQDWLDTEYDHMVHLNLHPTAARTWLLQMGSAAAKHGLTIQYCMSHCRHIMQSVEIPAVTNARASGDYHAGGDQWQQLGTTGIFAWSVGIAPTKDNFWSTDVQTGSSYDDYATIKEPYNRLQSVVSTLSKGPVAPSDKIGRSDVALIMKSCAKDGTLLQGDKPAMKVDSNHIQAAFQCDNCGPKGELWATTTTLAGNEPFAVVMGATLKENYKMALQELGLGNTKSSWVGYEANATASLVDVSQGISFKACGKWDFQIWAFAAFDPNSGFALLGEQSKWVPVSRARFSDLEHSSSMTSSGHWQEAAVTAKGSYGEELVVSWAHSESGLKPITIKCTIPESSTIRIRATRTDKSLNTYCGDHLYSN